MLLCLDFCVLHPHVYLIHEHYQIPSDKPHRLDDVNVHPPFSDPVIYDNDNDNSIKILYLGNIATIS